MLELVQFYASLKSIEEGFDFFFALFELYIKGIFLKIFFIFADARTLDLWIVLDTVRFICYCTYSVKNSQASECWRCHIRIWHELVHCPSFSKTERRLSDETHDVTTMRDEWWSAWFAEEATEEVTNDARKSRVGTVWSVDDIPVLLRFSKRYLNANNEHNDDALCRKL